MGKSLGTSAGSGRPAIPKRLQIYWSAFATLHKRRQFAYSGPQPLSLTDIQSYINLCFGYDSSYNPKLVRFVSAMDDAYLTNFFEKQSSKGS